MVGVRRGVSDAAITHADEHGRTAVEERTEGGGLVVDRGVGKVAFPCAAGRAGIFEPEGVLAWKADREDIGPVVAVEVVDPSGKVVGVAERIERLGRVEFVTRGEVGTGIPEGTGDGVDVTVAVEIAERAALGEKLGVQLELAKGERGARVGGRCRRRRGGENGRGGDRGDEGDDERRGDSGHGARGDRS